MVVGRRGPTAGDMGWSVTPRRAALGPGLPPQGLTLPLGASPSAPVSPLLPHMGCPCLAPVRGTPCPFAWPLGGSVSSQGSWRHHPPSPWPGGGRGAAGGKAASSRGGDSGLSSCASAGRRGRACSGLSALVGRRRKRVSAAARGEAGQEGPSARTPRGRGDGGHMGMGALLPPRPGPGAGVCRSTDPAPHTLPPPAALPSSSSPRTHPEPPAFGGVLLPVPPGPPRSRSGAGNARGAWDEFSLLAPLPGSRPWKCHWKL